MLTFTETKINCSPPDYKPEGDRRFIDFGHILSPEEEVIGWNKNEPRDYGGFHHQFITQTKSENKREPLENQNTNIKRTRHWNKKKIRKNKRETIQDCFRK